MSNPTIETDIAEILKDLQKGQKDILISLETVKGDIKALNAKVEQLDKRLARAFPSQSVGRVPKAARCGGSPRCSDCRRLEGTGVCAYVGAVKQLRWTGSPA